jgi:hypothetical protein
MYSVTCPTRYVSTSWHFTGHEVGCLTCPCGLYSCIQNSLGIIVTRDEDLAIERVEVPTGAYDTIQRDPFSFVAAETLSTLEVFSDWHLTVVAFATMTLIFIGQFSSDLLRAYVLPESFTWWGVR